MTSNWNGDLNKSYGTEWDLQFCSLLPFHLKSFSTQKLCFKFLDFEIHVYSPKRILN